MKGQIFFKNLKNKILLKKGKKLQKAKLEKKHYSIRVKQIFGNLLI